MAVKKAQSAKFYAIILFLVLLAGIFGQYALSSLTDTVIIQSGGFIGGFIITNGKDVYATSGSAMDIQAAVNAVASTGGTVHVPAGTFQWNGETVTIPGGVSVIGASPAGCKGHEDNWEQYTATTILHNNKAPSESGEDIGTMFYINGENGGSSRIANIQFEWTPPPTPTAEAVTGGSMVSFRNMFGVGRVDHCTFVNSCGTAVGSSRYTSVFRTDATRLLIDHCVVTHPYKTSTDWVWGYGFYVNGEILPDHNFWSDSTPDEYFGHWDTLPDGCAMMYVEDCYMSRCRHAFDAIQGGFYCARYNLIDVGEYNGYECGAIDMHGSGGSWISGKGCEAYNNIMTGNPTNQNIWMIELRDGSGLFYNNTMTLTKSDLNSYIVVLCNDDDGDYSYTRVSSTYIWGNSQTNCSSLLIYSGNYVENVNYFLRAPNQVQDGFTYMPYTYPHPLIQVP